MSKSYQSWTLYSIGIFVVWGIVFIARQFVSSNPNNADLALVFLGYFIGWLSATIKFVLVSHKKYGLTLK